MEIVDAKEVPTRIVARARMRKPLVLAVHATGYENLPAERGVGDAAMQSWLTESQSIAHIRHHPERYHVQ